MKIGDKIPMLDVRENRARQMSAAVMSALNDHICYHSRHDVYEALFELFTGNGVEVLTDYDREKAGLPARGPNGWTLEEVMAWERAKLDVLTRAPAPFIIEKQP